MIIQNSTIPLISPLQPAVARNDRSDNNQPDQNSKSNNPGNANPVVAVDRSAYQNRVQAIGRFPTSSANSSATQTESNNNIQVQTALSRYREFADPEAQANQEQIQLLFGIDVIV